MTVATEQLLAPKPSRQSTSESEAPHVKRWTKDEYNELVDRGFFNGMRLYLFRGELIEMAPMGNPHAQSIMKGSNWAFATFRPAFEVRVQMPFSVPDESMPEPDLLICTLQQNEVKPHPKSALLVIEVAESSLDHDRDKALEYAAAGVQEYWIVDLNDRCIEVYRNPVPDRTAPLGFRYPPPTVVKENESLAPLALPTANIKASDLLP
jgi:Uma2 family endonuclease